MNHMKWYRSGDGRMLGGVCAGLSQHWDLDVKLVRVFFVLAGMVSGLGAVLYVALWLTTPAEGMLSDAARDEVLRAGQEEIKAEAQSLGQGLQKALHHEDPDARFAIRLAVAILGAMMLKKMRPKVQHHSERSCKKGPEPSHSQDDSAESTSD